MLGFIARLSIVTVFGSTLVLQPAAAQEKQGAEAELKPGSVFRDCDECPEMVVVKAGTFNMGSPPSEPERLDNEGPQHLVTIAHSFAVGRYELTFAEWDACVSDGGCSYTPHDGSIGFGPSFGRAKRPVFNVSWDDTMHYMNWINSKVGKQVYRLPTEAEWEYAARAATTTPYAFGHTLSRSVAQFGANRTALVGSFPPNKFGLFDMHGNVSEWVQDCWNNSYEGAPTDGSAWTTGECGRRVVRGGAWNHPHRYQRAAYRDAHSFDARGYTLGFRLGRTLEALIAASPKAAPSDAIRSDARGRSHGGGEQQAGMALSRGY